MGVFIFNNGAIVKKFGVSSTVCEKGCTNIFALSLLYSM